MRICKIYITVFLTFAISGYACSFSSLAKKSDRIEMTDDNFVDLNGSFAYTTHEGAFQVGTVFQHFSKDTLTQNEYLVRLEDVTKKSLIVNLCVEDSLVKSIIFRGKFKKGLFRSKTKLTATFPLGILVWVLRNETIYFGLTPHRDLLVINDSAGVGLLVAFPIAGAGGDYSKILERK